MNYVDKVRTLAENEAKKIGLNIESVEWVFENEVYILRIIADKGDGLDIDDATALNEALSKLLDKEDFIKEEYMLEVSSPGIERELKDDSDIKNNIGEYVHIDFKNKFGITKDSFINEIEGYIDSVQEEDKKISLLVLKINIKGRVKKIEIEKENIKFIRKAIKF